MIITWGMTNKRIATIPGKIDLVMISMILFFPLICVINYIKISQPGRQIAKAPVDLKVAASEKLMQLDFL